MKPARFEHPIQGDVQPGDLWRVAEVSLTGHVIFERVQAPPDQFRSPGDGLHPRVPPLGSRPISAAEAQKLADEMDAAMAAGAQDAMRRHNELLAAALRAEGGPLTPEEREREEELGCELRAELDQNPFCQGAP